MNNDPYEQVHEILLAAIEAGRPVSLFDSVTGRRVLAEPKGIRGAAFYARPCGEKKARVFVKSTSRVQSVTDKDLTKLRAKAAKELGEAAKELAEKLAAIKASGKWGVAFAADPVWAEQQWQKAERVSPAIRNQVKNADGPYRRGSGRGKGQV